MILDEAPFIFALPSTPDTKKITVEEKGIVKAEQVRTEHTPVVTITSPNGGEVFSDDFFIEWEASDADNDVLSYAALLSDDSGETFNTLAIDLSETSFFVNVTMLNLSEGSEYLVKVLATDGINTGEDVSDSTFTIKRLSPYGLKLKALDKLKDMRDDKKCPKWFWWWSSKKCRDKHRLNKAIHNIEKSLNEKYWIDDYTLDPKFGHKVFNYEKEAVKELMKIEE